MGYTFDFELVLRFIPFLLSGVQGTVVISTAGFAVALMIGVVVAVLRLSGNRVINILLATYVDIFRSLPHLVALFWMFYAIPILVGFKPAPVSTVSVALGIAVGAGMSEVIRGGILSVHAGQWEASLAVGMTTWSAYRRIILPQAFGKMLPTIGSLGISIVKASALASIIGVPELMYQSNAIRMWTYRRVEVATVVAMLYFVLTYPLALVTNLLHRRFLHQE